MSFLLRWLGLDAPLRDARLRPYRRLDCDGDVAQHLERTRRAMIDILGASITRDEPDLLEGSIGLVDGERIIVRFEAIDGPRTRISIESVRPLGASPRTNSQYVDRLTEELAKA
uniref:DUF1499 domain-containing protein n=1 Tax=mine drainage metagenome TaxID=410659 RepID=E6Q4A8_9ZZZZ